MSDTNRALRRRRRLAGGLLATMALLMPAALLVPADRAGGWPAGLLLAAAKAGFVGGLADWFAVTALFRHPLGLPIPHTAILPAQQARLGGALGRFVADHVFTEAELARALARLDLPGLLARLLAEPETAAPLARLGAGLLPRLLASAGDGRVRMLAGRLARRLLGGAGMGRMAARALRALVADGRHQAALGFVLETLRAILAEREPELRAALEDRVREQGGRLVGWAVGGSMARRILSALAAELDRVDPDGSGLRRAFDEWARAEIDRLEADPERAAGLGRAIGAAVGEAGRGWAWDLWSRLRRRLEADAARPDGRAAGLAEAGLGRLAAMLAEDPALRAGVDRAAAALLRAVLPALRPRLAEYVGAVVGAWDGATLVERVESRLGPDLQWVRVNGTLVGFAAGGALYAALRLLGLER